MEQRVDAWLDEDPPEEALAGNPFEPGSRSHKQWRDGMACRWRVQKHAALSIPVWTLGDHA